MDTTYDVIIAGAGPIGTFLACELALRKISVLVLERDNSPENAWKSEPLGLRGLNTPSAEHFYRRGLLSKVCDVSPNGQPTSAERISERANQKPGFKFGGHFAGMFLDAGKMEMERWEYLIPGPSLSPRPTNLERIERVCAERAEELGVTIIRGCGVTGIVEQDDKSVVVEAGEEKKRFKGSWLVGCDGGRSVVRKVGGFDFVGSEPAFTGYIAQCEWEENPKIKPGWYHTDGGMYIVRSPDMLYAVEYDGGAYDRNQELSIEHFQQVFRRVSAIPDVEITKIKLSSTFTDRCKQVPDYRKGRVLVAGDAAHIHSPLGAQGLNLGLGDAMNLGWKLAATIKQETESGSSDMKLLDTYTQERQPMGAWVLEWQRVQVAVIRPDPWGRATRSLIQQLMGTKDGTNLFIDRFWGLSQKYELDGSHPLVGGSMPDFEFEDGSRTDSKLSKGKGLLVDFSGDEKLKGLVGGEKYGDQASYLAASAKDTLGLQALLVRPDGVVAWIAEQGAEPDLDAAKAALRKWFA